MSIRRTYALLAIVVGAFAILGFLFGLAFKTWGWVFIIPLVGAILVSIGVSTIIGDRLQ